MGKSIVEPVRPQMKILHMRIASWTTKATHTHHIQYLLLFHHNSGHTNAPQYSVIHTCILYIVYFILYIVYCIFYIVYCILCILYCILYILYCIVYILYCILYILYCILYIACLVDFNFLLSKEIHDNVR
jgi:hypothetical protein